MVYGKLKDARVEFLYGDAVRALLDNRDIISKMGSIQCMDYVLDLMEQIN